jgi:hypothetical protein
VSSTTTISEELSTSQPETSVDTTDVPHWITGDPIDSSGNESTTTPTILSTTFAELNDTVEGPTVQFQNYREGSTLHLFSFPVICEAFFFFKDVLYIPWIVNSLLRKGLCAPVAGISSCFSGKAPNFFF